MSEIYQIKPDKDAWVTQFKYTIDGRFRWHLQGIRDCPGCGATWAGTGLRLPNLRLDDLPTEARYRRVGPVPWPEHQELRRTLEAFLPAGICLEPGAEFGPLTGKAWGTFGDFAWPFWWVLLAHERTWERLRQAGVRIPPTVATELTLPPKHSAALLEAALPLAGRFHPDGQPPGWTEPCPTCGRHGQTLPVAMIIARDSIPDDIDVFRFADGTTRILATERFKRAAETLQLTDIIFEELVSLR